MRVRCRHGFDNVWHRFKVPVHVQEIFKQKERIALGEIERMEDEKVGGHMVVEIPNKHYGMAG